MVFCGLNWANIVQWKLQLKSCSVSQHPVDKKKGKQTLCAGMPRSLFLELEVSCQVSQVNATIKTRTSRKTVCTAHWHTYSLERKSYIFPELYNSWCSIASSVLFCNGVTRTIKTVLLCCTTAHALNMWIGERTHGVLVVVVVFSCQCWTFHRFFLVIQHAAIPWAFLSLFVLLKIPQKKSLKTVVQLGTEGIIALYVCISPWKKSILFFSFACSTFLKVLKETKPEINIIITLNLGSTNYERLLHWGLGLRKKKIIGIRCVSTDPSRKAEN